MSSMECQSGSAECHAGSRECLAYVKECLTCGREFMSSHTYSTFPRIRCTLYSKVGQIFAILYLVYGIYV